MIKKLTEHELLLDTKMQFCRINKIIAKHPEVLEEIFNMIPGWMHLNTIADITPDKLNRKMLNDLWIEHDELAEYKGQILENHVSDSSLDEAVKLLNNLSSSNNYSDVITFFQKCRYGNKKDFKWHFTSSKLLNDTHFISITNRVDSLAHYSNSIEKLLDDNHFFKQNFKKFDSLTPKEKIILGLIASGKENKEVALMLNISPLTVKTHRRNIIAKLNMNRLTDFIKFANAFDLIIN